jgi:hypothetical protein
MQLKFFIPTDLKQRDMRRITAELLHELFTLANTEIANASRTAHPPAAVSMIARRSFSGNAIVGRRNDLIHETDT